MAKYCVKVVSTVYYYVDASSEEEAKQKVLNDDPSVIEGDADTIGDDDSIEAMEL